MVKINVLAVALAAVALTSQVNALNTCDVVTDCSGAIVIDAACTSTGFTPAMTFTTSTGTKVCLTCPGKGAVNPDVYPYVTCDGKALCGKTSLGISLSPKQAQCILKNPSGLLTCATSPCVGEEVTATTPTTATTTPTTKGSTTTTATPTTKSGSTTPTTSSGSSSDAPSTSASNSTDAPTNTTTEAPTTSSDPTTAPTTKSNAVTYAQSAVVAAISFVAAALL